MLHFECDYLTGAHPQILRRLLETNMEPCSGYGSDPYTQSAEDRIARECGREEAQVFLLSGGTQTNRIVIDAMLHDCEGVIAADTGHISVHEAGAIEASGHKVIQLPGTDGKLTAEQVERFVSRFYADPNHPHMVYPGMVYLSHPTEYGTLYTLSELEAICQVCRSHQIPLYLDGARLGYGLMSDDTDVTLRDIAALCDVFYIGGTKVGAFCGEAVVFPRGNAPKYFFTTVKQNGALLAKGRLLGIQFDTLFTDGLYFRIARHAIDMSKKLKQILTEKGWHLYLDTPTNQQFVVGENTRLDRLSRQVGFDYWEPLDDTHSVVRFATSWSTTEEDLETLRSLL